MVIICKNIIKCINNKKKKIKKEKYNTYNII